MKTFYDGWRWHLVRRVPLWLYEHKCMKCGSARHLEVDHIIARGRGWFGLRYQYCVRNLQILCRDCNQAKGVEFADYRPWYWQWILPIWDEESRRKRAMSKFMSPKQQAYQSGRNGEEGGWSQYRHDPELLAAYQKGMAESEKFGPPDLSPRFIDGW